MANGKIICPRCGEINLAPRSPSDKSRCVRCDRPLYGSGRVKTVRAVLAKIKRPLWPAFWAVVAGLIVGLVIRETDWISVFDNTDLPTISGNPEPVKITGRASVIDGDTIEIHGQRIRLWGIDAPEGAQRCTRNGKPWRCGSDSAHALAKFLGARTVDCKNRDTDRYGRTVAVCTVGSDDLGGWQVRQGWALDFVRYSDGAYSSQELQAEYDMRGIWQGEFEPPWEWRKRNKK